MFRISTTNAHLPQQQSHQDKFSHDLPSSTLQNSSDVLSPHSMKNNATGENNREERAKTKTQQCQSCEVGGNNLL